MSTRLQIILVSVIALMAGLGFMATALVIHQPAPQIVKKHIEPSGDTSPMAQAVALIPSTSRVITAYPLSEKRYWVLAEKGELSQTWLVDVASSEVSLLREREKVGPDFTLISYEIEPSNENRNYFVVRQNHAWESPLTQQMDVIEEKTGALIVSAEWTGSQLTITKGDKRLNVTWFFASPCSIPTGESVVSAGGLEVNNVIVPFAKSKDVKCYANDFSGTTEYEGFTQPWFSVEVGDKKYIQFSLPDGDSVKIDIDQLDASGVRIQKVLQ